MSISERIKLLRQEIDLSKEELGKELGVTPMTIRNWESGVKTPSTKSVEDLSRLFNVSTDYLIGVSVFRESSNLNMSKKEIDLISNYRELDYYGQMLVDKVCSVEIDRVRSYRKPFISATPSFLGRFIPLYINPSAAGLSASLDGDDFEMIPVSDTVPADADFAVKIQGDSMYPVLTDGEIVYVKRSDTLNNGEIGIFSVDGSMYCKLFYRSADGALLLKSANPDLQSANICITPDSGSEVRCYGKVLLH